jgi:hypothetical protein
MSTPTSSEEGQGNCSSKTTQSGCCPTADGNGPLCCAPGGSSWGKGKALIALLIIIAAIAVGVNSWVKGSVSRTEAEPQATNCSSPCGAASGQPGKTQPGSCPSQSAATSTSSSCCPAQPQSDTASGAQPRN